MPSMLIAWHSQISVFYGALLLILQGHSILFFIFKVYEKLARNKKNESDLKLAGISDC